MKIFITELMNGGSILLIAAVATSQRYFMGIRIQILIEVDIIAFWKM